MDNNSLGHWIWFLFIGGVIGWLAGIITRGYGFGVFGDILIGIVGAMFGGWLAGVMGLYAASPLGAFMVALVGAVLLVALTRALKRIV